MIGMKDLLGMGAMLVALTTLTQAGTPPPGEAGNLGDRLTQTEVTSGDLDFDDLRREGRRIFSTPFNKIDGYGDGPVDGIDPTSPGHRPTLQNNGTYLRVNGLDAQTCLECHTIVSNATIPATLGIGGVGGAAANAIFQPRHIDVDDEGGLGFADFDGRFINPPFLFGSGGVELLGKEMTVELQDLKQFAIDNPGVEVELETKGVHFGSIIFENGQLDTSKVEGIDHDLVVRPFGRKGEFASVRAFDIEAMAFHFGMQATDLVGEGVDGDGDGVVDELLTGELSALHIFLSTMERPVRGNVTPEARNGFQTFKSIGCAECHIPKMRTVSSTLIYSHPEVLEDPFANPYYQVDLSEEPAGFPQRPDGGLGVPLFADLKRHDMGPGLAENFGSELDSEFTTARLWGVADTAPYLHDGRAQTLTEAILAHGGEAQSARDAFDALTPAERIEVLTFLRVLRTPTNPSGDLDE